MLFNYSIFVSFGYPEDLSSDWYNIYCFCSAAVAFGKNAGFIFKFSRLSSKAFATSQPLKTSYVFSNYPLSGLYIILEMSSRHFIRSIRVRGVELGHSRHSVHFRTVISVRHFS